MLLRTFSLFMFSNRRLINNGLWSLIDIGRKWLWMLSNTRLACLELSLCLMLIVYIGKRTTFWLWLAWKTSVYFSIFDSSRNFSLGWGLRTCTWWYSWNLSLNWTPSSHVCWFLWFNSNFILLKSFLSTT